MQDASQRVSTRGAERLARRTQYLGYVPYTIRPDVPSRLWRNWRSCWGFKVGVQAWREVTIGISRKFMRKKHAFRPDQEDEDGDVDKDALAFARTDDLKGFLHKIKSSRAVQKFLASREQRRTFTRLPLPPQPTSFSLVHIILTHFTHLTSF